MPRTARKKSSTNIYHIVMRGINRQIIFEDEEDCIRFTQTIQRYKEKCGYDIYAYCLMGNHVHILLKVGKEPLEQVMRRICGSYVYWYNQKYQRMGNLFQGRFKSEPVEDQAYFITVLRYIHQNPVKAGLVKSVEQYRWSSFNEYVKTPLLVDTEFALELFDKNKEKAITAFIKFNNEINDNVCLDIKNRHRILDEEAKNIVKKVCKIKNATDLQKFDRITRNRYLKKLKEDYSLSIRQLERITGINRGIILKA